MGKPKYSFKGNTAKNARIRIDYSGKKPNVQFSYPSKKNGTEGSMLPIIFLCWWVIAGIFLVGFRFHETITFNYESNSTNETTIVNGTYYNVTTYDGCVGFMNARVLELSQGACETLTNPFNNSNYTAPKFWPTLKEEIKKGFDAKTIFIFLFLFVPPLLIYFPFRKSWKNLFPKFMGLGKKKFTFFNTKDIKYTKELGYYCELPVFNNVVLNYEATKEFSKYLTLIDIREHKFKYWMGKPTKRLTKHEKKRRIRKSLNDKIWYARFFFIKKPTTGRLEVLYK